MTRTLLTTALATVLAAGLGTARAQEAAREFISIEEWDPATLYDQPVLSGEIMLEAEVYDADGESLGEVETIYIADEDDRIVAIGAEVGGFLDIGDVHVIVPWDRVEQVPEGFRIPVDEDTVEDYELGGDEAARVTASLSEIRAAEDTWTTGSVYPLTDLVGDMVMLSDGDEAYGWVTNAYFTPDGRLIAVIVDASSTYGGGRYAYPYRGPAYGYWPPGYRYDLGFGSDDIGGRPTIDEDEVDVVAGD